MQKSLFENQNIVEALNTDTFILQQVKPKEKSI
jgi:hypothetical protein